MTDLYMEHAIKIAADSIEQLRKVDVYRVLEQSDVNMFELGGWIAMRRPDLVQEVAECLQSLTTNSD